MRKLKLDMESLNVESFSTGHTEDAEGTVHGHVRATDPNAPTTSMNDQMTCGQNSCAGASCYTCSICMTFDNMCIQNQFQNVAELDGNPAL
jgi:hypothetical protein